MIIVRRTEDEKRLESLPLPLFVYGRRKTGKTFLIKRFFSDALYFFVRRDKTVYYEKRNENINVDELLRIIEESKKTIIVDEFHRLGGEFLDFLHIKQPRNLVLVTSTLNLAKKLLTEKTPILGLFMEFRLDIIRGKDILEGLSGFLKGRELIEACVYLREPLLLRFFRKKIDLNALKLTVPALIGEIFEEEERVMSKRYEGIVRAIAAGKNNLTEITSYLHSYRLIERQDVSIVKQYLKNLMEMGIVRRVRDYHRNRYYYFISSPVIDLYYYLDEKYNFSENDLDGRYFREKLGKHVEWFVRDLFADVLKKNMFMISRPEHEIDIVLGDFKKIRLVGEVKWKKRLSEEEMKSIEEKLNLYDCKRILVVPERTVVRRKLKGIEIMDSKDILKLVRNPGSMDI